MQLSLDFSESAPLLAYTPNRQSGIILTKIYISLKYFLLDIKCAIR